MPAPAPIEGLETQVVSTAADGGARAWDGVVEAVREAGLTAQTRGRVAEVLHDVNDRVAAGEVLVRLTAVEQQAGVDAARAQLQLAEATYRRMAGLAENQYVSKMQLDQARAERDAARARLVDAGQQSTYTTIRAPYAGIVSAREVEPGESVGIGQPLMTVFAPDALRIELSVPQSDADAIRADPAARIAFDDGRNVGATDGVVFPAADVATHAVRVRVQLPQLAPAPQPGMTAKVAFPALAGAARPRVPASSLVRRGEVNAVYVLANGRLMLRQLRLGARDGDSVEVIAGLEPGEVIAADPVAAVQALVAARRNEK
ncbi:efflux transporter periplasmic adaptor subunit [Pseudoxanthomonas koreensis]|nr:efflux transporter periplasmic adaptor subunit [Pseudoxanthomonas koreensis]